MVRAACAAPWIAGCATPGSGLPLWRDRTRGVADHEHFGMARDRQIGLDDHAAGRRAATPSVARAARPRRPPPTAPCRRCEPLRRRHRRRAASIAVTARLLAHLDAEPLQRRARGVTQLSAESRQHRRPGLDERRCARARCRWTRNSSRSVWRAISASVPASSTPVGPPPTSTNVSSSCCRAASVSRSARSNASRMRRRISSASSSVFRPGRVLLPLGVAEVGVARAGRDDQVVVVERRAVLQRDPALRRRSIALASPSSTRTFRARRRIQRIGAAMSPGDSVAVAT